MALEIRELKKTYNDTESQSDFSVYLDFEIGDGETLALVGPSGSGKTTAINLISGLAAPELGKVIIDGEDVSRLPSWRRNISLVFQDLALFPHLNVGGNIAYSLFIRHVPKKERRRIVEETLNTVRLPGFASRRIHTLSGGERQRVALARALAPSPRALLLDEPFSSLDLPLRKEMRQEFLEIRSRSKAPCIFVTHDREEAVMLGDKVALMMDGRIVEFGTGRDLFLEPKTEFAARFFGAGIVLPQAAVQNVLQDAPLGNKYFIPHDAISLREPSVPGWKALSAHCISTYFNGPNMVVKLSLPDSKASEIENSFEIIAEPRLRPPKPGCILPVWVEQSLIRFVK